MHFLNGDPGLRHIVVSVNDVRFQERSLVANQRVTLDIASALHAGSNTAVIIAKGKQRGEATIVIADS